jgi:hypothetical protein
VGATLPIARTLLVVRTMPALTLADRRTNLEILAHRGCPRADAPGNSIAALRIALESGYGVETDIRDFQGEIVIAHDPPAVPCHTLRDFLALYRELESSSCLALNVKSCGLAQQLASLLCRFEVDNFFAFDMAVPDARSYARAGLRFFTRQSELETQPALYAAASGVWLDAFDSTWYDERTIERHLRAGKDVCIVSPELHGREATETWAMLRKPSRSGPARLMICTDHPDQVASHFYVMH